MSAESSSLARDSFSFGPSLTFVWSDANAIRCAYLFEQGTACEHAHRIDLTYSRRF